MSDSNRGARTPVVGLIALVAISCLTTLLVADLLDRHRKTVQQYEANSRSHAAHTEYQIENCFSVAEDIGKAECIRKAVDSQGQNERAEADLVAQREMSNWALGMLYVTTLMALVTGLGVYFVWRTLKATQQMAIDTREIGEAQVRAYVHFKIEDIDIAAPPGLFKNGQWSALPAVVTISGKLHNSGQSPARRIVCRYDIQSVHKDKTIQVDARFMPAKTLPSATVVPSGESVSQHFRRQFLVDWAALMSGVEHIWFIFALSYEDAFENDIDDPVSAGHIDGAGELVKALAFPKVGKTKVALRFVWNQIEAETTYSYDDGK